MRFLYARTNFPTKLTVNVCLLLSFFIITLSVSVVNQSNAKSPKHSTVKISSDITILPKPVREMRTAIINAAKTGKLAAMQPVLESNEILPIVSFGSTQHPIDFWKSASKDGKGKDILADMLKVFSLPYAVENAGTSKERYIWPYLAELAPHKLSSKQKADLVGLTSSSGLSRMKSKKRYLFYRASIGRDGTWHVYALEE